MTTKESTPEYCSIHNVSIPNKGSSKTPPENDNNLPIKTDELNTKYSQFTMLLLALVKAVHYPDT